MSITKLLSMNSMLVRLTDGYTQASKQARKLKGSLRTKGAYLRLTFYVIVTKAACDCMHAYPIKA
eukprot:1051687-Pleurochrysis_carterae.AAC.3